MTSSAGSSISTVFVMMNEPSVRRNGRVVVSIFRSGENAPRVQILRFCPIFDPHGTNCAPLAAKWIKMAIVRATLRGTVARAAP